MGLAPKAPTSRAGLTRMSPRRPVASLRSAALPTLVALLAAGVAVEGCINDAQAQTPPAGDAGVRPPTPQPTYHPIRPAGRPMPVYPTPSNVRPR